MAATPSSDPKSAGDDRNLVAGLSFEDRVHLFWNQNRNLVLATCAAIVLIILAKGGWDYMQRQKNLQVGQAYAAASTTEQLRTFAAANRDHPLGAIAELRIADESYANGKSTEAIAGYDRVLSMLEDGALAARARLGRALAKLQAGQNAAGTTELQQLANDVAQFNAVRAEAAYHLASLAAAAGNAAEVQKFSEQLMQIDPSSPWVPRVMSLRASMPVAPAAAPGATASPAERPQDDGPRIELNLPGR